MATQPEPLRLTLEQYLEWEDRQGTRHEFVDGLVFALAGASDTHQTILANLTTLVRPALRGSASRIFTNEIKVIPPNRRRARYPDLLVTCDERDRADRYVKRYPELIIEVLSPSTAATARTEKLDEYQTIPTLDELRFSRFTGCRCARLPRVSRRFMDAAQVCRGRTSALIVNFVRRFTSRCLRRCRFFSTSARE